MEKPLIPPVLSPTLFWDTDMANIDWEKHAPSVIERVLTRGTLAEWDEIVRYYGEDFIRDTALNLRYMDRATLWFCSGYFNQPLDTFRCYTSILSSPEPWYS